MRLDGEMYEHTIPKMYGRSRRETLRESGKVKRSKNDSIVPTRIIPLIMEIVAGTAPVCRMSCSALIAYMTLAG